jgi:hypothetical protein
VIGEMVNATERESAASRLVWKLESVELEVHGRTLPSAPWLTEAPKTKD